MSCQQKHQLFIMGMVFTISWVTAVNHTSQLRIMMLQCRVFLRPEKMPDEGLKMLVVTNSELLINYFAILSHPIPYSSILFSATPMSTHVI